MRAEFNGVLKNAKFVLALLVVVAEMCACSRHETPRTLARRVGEADRVTMTDRYDRNPFTIVLTPEEATRLVQAVSTAKKESPLITATAGFRIAFFKGTNLLGEFNAGSGVFWIDHGPDRDQAGLRRVTPYSDSTSTLETLRKKFWHAKAAAQTATNRTAP